MSGPNSTRKEPDLLEDATRALFEETCSPDGTEREARATRTRIMASLHRHERRRRSRLAFLLPIAAVLVGSSAFAASGGRFDWQSVARAVGIGDSNDAPGDSGQVAAPPQFRRALTSSRPVRAVAPEPAEPAQAPDTTEPAPEPSAVSAPTPMPTSAASVPAPAAAAPPAAAPTAPAAEPAQAAPAAPSTEPPPGSGAPIDPALELYRTAHRLHFEAGNAAAALAAWDRYLQKAPRGRFALEASYNRAICLVRLGRKAEARQALEPFARGAYGPYRKASAQSLLDALGGG